MIPTASSTRPVQITPAHLRPRSVGEIIDGAFRLYRKHFLTYLTLVAVLYIPIQLLFQALNIALISTEVRSVLNNSILISNLQEYLAYLAQTAVILALIASYANRSVSFGGIWRDTLRRAPSVLTLMGLQVLIWLLAATLAILSLFLFGPNSGTRASSSAAFWSILALLTFLPYYSISLRLQLALPAALVEGLSPWHALKRSWALVKGYWWRTFGLSLLLGLISAAIALGPVLVVTLIVNTVLHPDASTTRVLISAESVLTGLFVAPLQWIAIAIYYFDLRVRKEGLDLEMALAQRYTQGTAHDAAEAEGENSGLATH